MRQRKMWSRLFVAAAGVFALAASASAQNPPAVPPVPPVTVQPPLAGPTIPPVPAFAAGTVAAPAPATRGFTMAGGYVGSNCQYGNAGCNSGCGSCKSDNAFIFGSCKSFFDPCGPTGGGHGFGHGRGCGGGLFGGGHCPKAPILGRGPAGPFNPCVYDSYANH